MTEPEDMTPAVLGCLLTGADPRGIFGIALLSSEQKSCSTRESGYIEVRNHSMFQVRLRAAGERCHAQSRPDPQPDANRKGASREDYPR